MIKHHDHEKQNKSLTLAVNKATEKAALYCNVSMCTIRNITKEERECSDEVLGSPSKKFCAKNQTASVDDFDHHVILNIIQDFYVNKKTVPIYKKLLLIVKECINFQ